MAGSGRTSGRPSGAAGRAPRSGRAGASRARRTRAGLPARAATVPTARMRRSTLTARAAILAVAVASVALALALPFKIWIAQRSQISSLQAQTRQQERSVAQLEQQQQRWNDPAYVKQQARLRLHYAMPGEKTYVVLDTHKSRKPAPKAEAGTTKVPGPGSSRLWQSVQAAGAADSSS